MNPLVKDITYEKEIRKMQSNGTPRLQRVLRQKLKWRKKKELHEDKQYKEY